MQNVRGKTNNHNHTVAMLLLLTLDLSLKSILIYLCHRHGSKNCFINKNVVKEVNISMRKKAIFFFFSIFMQIIIGEARRIRKQK